MAAIVPDPYRAQARLGVMFDVPQPPTGARYEDDPPGEMRGRHGQLDRGFLREPAPDLDGPANAHRDVSGGALAGIDRGDPAPRDPDGDEELLESGYGAFTAIEGPFP